MLRLAQALIFFSIILYLPTASAQQLEETYNDWSVFAMQNKGEKMCYVASTPNKKSGNYNKRGEPYLIVTHRSKTVDEVSASSGYPYKQNSNVDIKVDKKHDFKLFTTLEVPEVAWAKDSEEDTKIVNAMKKGLDMTVKGNSRLGSYSLDTYSLRGFSRAYQHMKKSCK